VLQNPYPPSLIFKIPTTKIILDNTSNNYILVPKILAIFKINILKKAIGLVWSDQNYFLIKCYQPRRYLLKNLCSALGGFRSLQLKNARSFSPIVSWSYSWNYHSVHCNADP